LPGESTTRAATRVDERTRTVAADLARKLLLAEPFEHRHGPEAGLAEVADREQPEPAVEEGRRLAELDEVIRGDRTAGQRPRG